MNSLRPNFPILACGAEYMRQTFDALTAASILGKGTMRVAA
jgi:hypothetical protein